MWGFVMKIMPQCIFILFYFIYSMITRFSKKRKFVIKDLNINSNISHQILPYNLSYAVNLSKILAKSCGKKANAYNIVIIWSRFQSKQLSVGQHKEYAHQIWFRCKMCEENFGPHVKFSIAWNGFLMNKKVNVTTH